MKIENISILIVDDSQTLRSIFRRMLINIGFRDVLEASSGVDALAILMSHKPDIIITDINMEPMNGLVFISKIRSMEKYKAIPIILISTDANEKNLLKAKDLGVKRFLSKPFSQKQLQDSISYLVSSVLKAPKAVVSEVSHGGKVLIVDDSQVIIGIVQKILSNIGFKDVHSAKSGNAAWTKILEISPNLILSDVHMKDGSGVDLLKMIRSSKEKKISEIKIILMSSDLDIKNTDEVKLFKPSAVLEKPYKMEDLKECLVSIGFLK